jgi:hypothetical protein
MHDFACELLRTPLGRSSQKTPSPSSGKYSEVERSVRLVTLVAVSEFGDLGEPFRTPR